ncbi:MAG: oligosaccharide flippase family protein [Thermoplasmatales archaeon]|nr:oligosaccharide flippase family protein [Thermoplasmatales archaeon]MCW6170429.1 oligosaccharide flippase family protein [Thermoplasmatales archaeon]
MTESESRKRNVRSLGGDALYLTVQSGVQLVSGAIFYIIIVRLFDTTIVGAIALMMAIVGLFSVIFSFGLGTAASHFVAFHIGREDFASARKSIQRIVLYGFLLSSLGFALTILLAPELSMIFFKSYSYVFIVRLLSTVVFGTILLGVLNGSLIGLELFRLSAIISIVVWSVYYFSGIFLAFFIRSIHSIIIAWIIGIFLGVVIEAVVLWRIQNRFPERGSVLSTNVLFMYSMPILFSSLMSYGASYTDRFVVAGLMHLSELGVYNFALLITSSVGFIATPFTTILLPKFSEFFAHGRLDAIRSNVRSSITILSFLYIPSALGIGALSPMILALLGGAQYTSGSYALTIIMFSSALFVGINVLSQSVSAIRKTKVFMFSSAAALASNVAVSIALIPIFGLVGASIGYSSVYASSFLMIFYFARKEGVSSFNLKSLGRIWISSLTMFAIVLLLVTLVSSSLYLLPVYIVLGAGIYLGLVKALKAIEHTDRDLLVSILSNNLRSIRRLVFMLWS